MQLFPTHDAVASVLGGATKWQRTLQALRNDPLPEVTYSVGDSLTYRRTRTSTLAAAGLVGRRRYHLVLAPITGAALVDVAATSILAPAIAYSDLTDRQTFTGAGDLVEVPEAGVLIADIDEAVRVHAVPDVDVVVLHVTVEGATFANK